MVVKEASNMGNVKTAISIDKPLFEQINNLAHEMNTFFIFVILLFLFFS